MKSFCCLLAVSLMYHGCSSQPAPAWQANGHMYLNSFIDCYMAGERETATVYYRLLMAELQRTGDPDIIVRGPLTICAMDRALLRETSCEDAQKYLSLLEDPQNKQYFQFLTGNRSEYEEIPEKYKAVYFHSKHCNLRKIKKTLSNYESPLSLLTAAEIALSNGCYDADMIKRAADIASSRGWTFAVLIYLTRLREYYEVYNQREYAERINKRISMMQRAVSKSAPPY